MCSILKYIEPIPLLENTNENKINNTENMGIYNICELGWDDCKWLGRTYIVLFASKTLNTILLMLSILAAWRWFVFGANLVRESHFTRFAPMFPSPD